MRRLLAATATLALALTLATAARADYVKLKDGGVVRGEAVSYDDATQTLTFRMEDGSLKGYPMSELDKRSVYLVNRSRVPKDDFDKQMRIGRLAQEVNLYAHAMRHFEQARADAPARAAEVDAAVAQLKKEAAVWGMQKAKDALSKGDKKEAEQWLVKLAEKLPDEPQGAQARQMLDQYYAGIREARQTEVLAKASEAQQKQLAGAKESYDAMVAKTSKGLSQNRTGNGSVTSWNNALRDGERALKELDKVDTSSGGAVTADQLDGYRKMVVDQMVEIHLHLASLWTVRSSYNEALTQVNQALALDSRSESALAARSRVEQAASERGWIW